MKLRTTAFYLLTLTACALFSACNFNSDGLEDAFSGWGIDPVVINDMSTLQPLITIDEKRGYSNVMHVCVSSPIIDDGGIMLNSEEMQAKDYYFGECDIGYSKDITIAPYDTLRFVFSFSDSRQVLLEVPVDVTQPRIVELPDPIQTDRDLRILFDAPSIGSGTVTLVSGNGSEARVIQEPLTSLALNAGVLVISRQRFEMTNLRDNSDPWVEATIRLTQSLDQLSDGFLVPITLSTFDSKKSLLAPEDV